LEKKIDIIGYSNTIEKLFGIIEDIYKKINNNFKIPNFDEISFFPKELSPDAYGGCKSNKESFDDYIRQVFFGPVISAQNGKSL
jgi:hypothetical protein